MAGDRFEVDGAVEGNRQPRLDVEAIEGVDYVEVLAVRRVG